MKNVLFCSVMLMAVSMFARQYVPPTAGPIGSTTYYSTSDGVFGSATTHSDGSVFFFNSDGSSGEVKYIGGSAYVNYTDAPKSYYVTTPDTSFVRYTPEPEPERPKFIWERPLSEAKVYVDPDGFIPTLAYPPPYRE